MNVQELRGVWNLGWALDLHTVSGGPHRWYSRSKIGEALFQLKYLDDRSKVAILVKAACDFMAKRNVTRHLSAIIPVPPSDTTRVFQPVPAMAAEIGETLGIPALLDALRKTRCTAPLKNIDDVTERRSELSGAFCFSGPLMSGKIVLVFDDLYRSGETLNEVARVLYNLSLIHI